MDRGIGKWQTTFAYLKELERIGVLEEKQAGKGALVNQSPTSATAARDAYAPTPFAA